MTAQPFSFFWRDINILIKLFECSQIGGANDAESVNRMFHLQKGSEALERQQNEEFLQNSLLERTAFSLMT